MQISVDISLYPLQKAYREPIKAFIDRLEQHPEFIIARNSMSTTILADYQQIMPVLTAELATTLKEIPKSVFVIKLSGGCQ